MAFIPSVLRKPRARMPRGPLTEPLYSAMVGGDPVDANTRLGSMGEMHRQALDALDALGGHFAAHLPNGVKVRREASGGVSVSYHFPPGIGDVHDVLTSSAVDMPPAGWWLDNGEAAPGTPGHPLRFTAGSTDGNE